jgi:glycine/D-amino acid oxidase-like deaminating enzyme
VEPTLAPEVQCGVLSRDEQCLHPGRLVRALARAASHKGAAIRTGCPALGVRQEDGRFEAVSIPDGEISAGQLVVAAGAWSPVPCSWFGAEVPISPARGQMVSLVSTSQVVRRPIFSYNGAVLPKLDGSVQIGSTVELVGFDVRPTAEGIASILEVVSRLTPGLGTLPIDRIWAGLRPWCEDGVPAIGRLPGCENVSLASGHFKLGILGSAITAQTVADLVAHDRVDPLIEPFSPSRFSEDEG